ncbi:MAG TPA: site-2 protease family protein [Stenomitos sp.]
MLGIFSGGLDTYGLINRALIWVPLLIVSLSLHEFGHAATAYALGDETPKREGRVTLNPLAHMDPLGTLMILFGPIGWGKPVHINPANLRWRQGELLVSFAGPGMNLVLAFLAVAALKYLAIPAELEQVHSMLSILFVMNVGLAVFNLLPIPPLDGGHIWTAILPYRWRGAYYHLLPYGIILLILMVMWPGANFGIGLLIQTVGHWIYNLLP